MQETKQMTRMDKGEEKRKLRSASLLNWLLFACEVFSLGWMISGISTGPFSARSFGSLRYFTVDSNLLLGIFSLIAAIAEGKAAAGKKESVSPLIYILKLMGTVGTTLTMLVTALYLAPTSSYGYFSLFAQSTLFLHLINPLLGLVVFWGFERTKELSFKHTFTGVLPMLLYSIYYVEETLRHLEGESVMQGYDWYGFLVMGVRSVAVILPLFIFITYLISLVLWKINRGGKKA